MTFFKLGILGCPVQHSRSPAMQHAALAAAGLEGRYEKIEVAPADLPRVVASLEANGFTGVNVTLPHKQAVLPLLDEVDAVAREIGAVNTVCVREGRLFGTNTDAEGLVRSIRAAGVELQGVRVLVLGAGGAARAATTGLHQAGALVRASARRIEAARALPHAEAVAWNDQDAWADTELLVQATSATMGHGADAFVDGLPLDRLSADAAVVDLVYTPLDTALLRAARTRGVRTIDGLGMLVHQGALAFEHWTGHVGDIDAMRDALTGE